MKNEEILTALRRLKVETGSLACMGCGHEHDCGINGCRIAREAAELIEKLTDRCARYAEEIAVLQERTRWVPVEERLPRPGERVLATEGTFSAEAYMTSAHTWRRNYGVLWRDAYGMERPVTHWMPLPAGPEVE